MREFDRRRANITQSALAALLAIGSTACGTNAASGQGGPEVSKNPGASQSNEGPKFPFSGTWYLTAGPHTDGYAQNGEPYALDFAPKPVIACPSGPTPTEYFVEASASGKVTVVGNPNDRTDPNHSVVKIEHPDGSVLGYMHLDNIKVTKGQEVRQGEPLGNPSCEIPPGGKTTGVHVHQFLEKLGKGRSVIGSIISGWKIEKDGRLTKAGEIARQGNAARCDTAQSCGGVRNDLMNDSQASTANPKEGASPIPPVLGITPTITVPMLNPTETPKPPETEWNTYAGKRYQNYYWYQIAVPTTFTVEPASSSFLYQYNHTLDLPDYLIGQRSGGFRTYISIKPSVGNLVKSFGSWGSHDTHVAQVLAYERSLFKGMPMGVYDETIGGRPTTRITVKAANGAKFWAITADDQKNNYGEAEMNQFLFSTPDGRYGGSSGGNAINWEIIMYTNPAVTDQEMKILRRMLDSFTATFNTLK